MTRRLIGQIHLWAGLVLCIPFALLGLTGSVLVFQDELNQAFGPAARHVAAGGAARPTSDIIAAARAVAPAGFVPIAYTAPTERAVSHPCVSPSRDVPVRAPSGLASGSIRSRWRQSPSRRMACCDRSSTAFHVADEEPGGASAHRLARCPHARDGHQRPCQLVASPNPMAVGLLRIEARTGLPAVPPIARDGRHLGAIGFLISELRRRLPRFSCNHHKRRRSGAAARDLRAKAAALRVAPIDGAEAIDIDRALELARGQRS